jgi:integrase
MPRTKLTELTAARLKPPPTGRLEVWDTLLPAFGLRITAAGGRSWIVAVRKPGATHPSRHKLGEPPAMTLADARTAARAILADPDTAFAERKQPPTDSFETVAAQFLERYVKRHQPRTWDQTEGRIRTKLLPAWSGRPIHTITRRDVLDVLDREVDDGRERTANKMLQLIAQLFGWAIERGIIEDNPTPGIRRPGREQSRDRVLEADELAAIWRATESFTWPWQPFVRLLVLTAQRRDEVAGMRWSELDPEGRIWRIPRERAKSDREHVVPLSPLAVEIIEGLSRLGDLLFPAHKATSTNPISGFSKVKRRLDELSGVEGWRLHDLTRTAASGMARLGHPPHVVAAILNHSPGSTMGITAVYNRFRYEDEKRAALAAWSREVERITGREDRKVVALRG